MKRTVWVRMFLLASVTLVLFLGCDDGETATASLGGEMPTFEVDPDWPTIPDGWVLGVVASVAVDSRDHVWVLQRPGSLGPEEMSMAAPPVLEFDPEGNYVQGWGGPSPEYHWPQSEHGIFVDHNDYVWVGGNGGEDQVLKFTMGGELVMQIGRPGESQGNRDTQNLGRPADVWVHPPTNELFVADGYGNRRIIVYDADTGEFKRMWGAFGNEVSEGVEADPAWAREQEGPGPPALRPAGARGQGIQRRARLRLRPWRQACAGLHARGGVRITGVHRPRMPGAGMRQRHDGRQHGVFVGPGAALSLRREPQSGAGHGARA